MHSKLALFTLTGMLFAALGSAAAAPAAEPDANALAARDPSTGKVHVCTDWNWGGSCTNVYFNNAQCTNFPSSYQDDISSIGPDGGWTCVIYVDWFCATDEGSVTIAYPGISKVTFDNDAFSSFVCTWSG